MTQELLSQGSDGSPFRVVDLSAPLSSSTVLWPGGEAMSATVIDDLTHDGSFSRRVTLGEHSGTHFDAPCHFAPGGAAVADVPVDQLVRPLRVVDISTRAKDDPAAELSGEDIKQHEMTHGLIERGSAVFLRTGWDAKRLDPLAYSGEGGTLSFPGFGVEAARLLVHERGVVGLGIDTLGIDPGHAADFPVHRDISLPHGVWHVENAINLGELPPSGSWVVVGVPRVVAASGFPARVLALVPVSTPVSTPIS